MRFWVVLVTISHTATRAQRDRQREPDAAQDDAARQRRSVGLRGTGPRLAGDATPP